MRGFVFHACELWLGQRSLLLHTRAESAGSSTRRQSLCRWPRFRLQFTYSKYLLKIVLLQFQFVHLYSFEKQDIHVHARSNNTASLPRPRVHLDFCFKNQTFSIFTLFCCNQQHCFFLTIISTSHQPQLAEQSVWLQITK